MSTPQIHRVLAGPGSGKTRLLTEEIRNQLMQDVAAQAIVGITFTRRAAEELKARLQSGTSRNTPIPWVGTFHQLARRIQFELEQLPSPIDLDRLIPDATALLTTGARPPWAASLRFIGVDEAQDLDEEQVEFLKALRAHSPSAALFLVGDPDQAIYGFRRASPRFLLSPDTYFTSPVQTIVLNENHRSAREIVAMAQAILAHDAHPDSPCRSLKATRPEAHPAVRELTGRSPEDEARLIFQEIRTLLAVGVPAEQQAILVRTRAQFAPLQAEATRWRIPLYTPPLDDRVNGTPPPPPQRTVALLTIHQAKGCEWTVIFLAGCQAGLIPHAAATTRNEREEERRLLYVAITRAKQLLWLCRHGAPSPLLDGIPPVDGHELSYTPSGQPSEREAPPESLRRRITGWLRY